MTMSNEMNTLIAILPSIGIWTALYLVLSLTDKSAGRESGASLRGNLVHSH